MKHLLTTTISSNINSLLRYTKIGLWFYVKKNIIAKLQQNVATING